MLCEGPRSTVRCKNCFSELHSPVRSNGSHPQQEGTDLGCIRSCMAGLTQGEATNLGVFDLCLCDLLKRRTLR